VKTGRGKPQKNDSEPGGLITPDPTGNPGSPGQQQQQSRPEGARSSAWLLCSRGESTRVPATEVLMRACESSRIANPNTLRQHFDRIAFTSPEQI
jgi:hypothetical protein